MKAVMETERDLLQKRVEEMAALLRDRGFRLTPQRLAVLNLLAASSEHPGAEQIYEQVRKDFPTTTLATVYKTINVLKEIGQLVEVAAGEDFRRYDASQSRLHPHLICTRCHSIVDLEMDFSALEGVDLRVEQGTGYRRLVHRLDFYGLCPRCAQQGV